MSQLIYEAFSVGVITVFFGNVTACILDFLVLAPRLKIKLPFPIEKDNFYQMGIILFLTQILFFFYFKPHVKFWNPTITPSGRKVTAGERRKRKNSATAHANRSGQFICIIYIIL